MKFLLAVVCCLVACSLTNGQIPDYSFRDAIDATLAQLKADGSYSRLLPLALERAGFMPVDCSANPALYPYPNRVAGTFLDTILKRGIVRVVGSSSNSTAQQEIVAFQAELLKRLGAHYLVDLTVQYTVYSSSATALDLVTNRTVDLAGPNFAFGGTYKGVARKLNFYQLCGWLDGLQMFTVLNNSPITGIDSIRNGVGLSSVTNGAGTLANVQAVFPNVQWTLNTTLNVAQMVAQMKAGVYNFLPVGLADLTVEGVNTTGFREFPGGFDRLNGGLIAMSTLTIPAPTSAPTSAPTAAPTSAPTAGPTCGPSASTVINVNFAGLLNGR